MAGMLWLGLSEAPLLERRQRSFGVQIQTETLPVRHWLSSVASREPAKQSLAILSHGNLDHDVSILITAVEVAGR
jgi:hypothetical protein